MGVAIFVHIKNIATVNTVNDSESSYEKQYIHIHSKLQTNSFSRYKEVKVFQIWFKSLFTCLQAQLDDGSQKYLVINKDSVCTTSNRPIKTEKLNDQHILSNPPF